MKHTLIFLYALPVLGLSILTGCNQPGNKTTTASSSTTTAASGPVNGARIAYVNIDSLEAKYELLKTKRDEFKRRQEQMEGELQRSYQQMQTDYAEVQKKAQAHTLTESEGEAAQKRLSQMQQSLETRKQTLTEQLMKEQEDFNKDLKKRLDAFLEGFNKNHSYDYILSYSAAGGSSILYANKQYDITQEVVNGMNDLAKKDGEKK